MTDKPGITVITPVRDGARYLAAMIASVGAQAAGIRHLVIDDGSTDATPHVLAAHAGQVETITLPASLVPAAALNRGFADCTTSHVLIVDADDLLMPGQLDRLARAIERQPEIDLVFSGWREFAELGLEANLVVRDTVRTGYISTGTLVRRGLHAALGGFDAAIRLGSFIDFASRARAAGASELVLPELGLMRRVHGANMTLRERDRVGDMLAVARAAAARRRASP